MVARIAFVGPSGQLSVRIRHAAHTRRPTTQRAQIANGTHLPVRACGSRSIALFKYLYACVWSLSCEVSVSLVCRVSLGGAALDFLSTLLKYRLKYIRQPTAPALTA